MIQLNKGLEQSPEYVRLVYKAFSDSIVVFDDDRQWVVRQKLYPELIGAHGAEAIAQRAVWLESPELIAELAEKLRDLKDVTYHFP